VLEGEIIEAVIGAVMVAALMVMVVELIEIMGG